MLVYTVQFQYSISAVDVPVLLERGYLTLDELGSVADLDVDSDPRSYKHALGHAIHLRYDPSFVPEFFPQNAGITFDHHRLVSVAVQLCGRVFYEIDSYERY